MAKDTTSPFTPGLPVPLEFFVGRLSEIKRLDAKMRDAVASRRLQVGFMEGERGIGKTSLATFVRVLAERNHNTLTAHAFLGGARSLEEMTRRVFDHLLKESVEKPWFAKLRGLFGRHIQEIGLFGVSVGFRAEQEELRHIANHFPTALESISKQLGDEKRGLMLILDDINGLASEPEFADWLKSVVDEIATSARPYPLFLLLVGLEERRRSLLQLQPSLARVFDTVEIAPWSMNETELFFETAFQTAGVSVDPVARQFLAGHTGGLPVLAHEIGSAVFKVDEDGQVDMEDASAGVLDAAEIVGRKYLEPQVLHVVRSRRYRSILRHVGSEHFKFSFSRSVLATKLPEPDRRVLDNFLKRMTNLGVVVRTQIGGQENIASQIGSTTCTCGFERVHHQL